jgi:hypothetical protein
MMADHREAAGDEASTAPRSAPHEPGFHDSILLDEPTTADLRAKVTEAWQEFARALAAGLRELPSGSQIDITLDPTASGTGEAVYSVNIEIRDEGVIGARAVGNAALPAGFRLDRAAVADMVALGWSPPGVVAGSGEHFGFTSSVAEAGRLSTTISRTLRDIYGAPHPAFLVFFAHDDDGELIPVAPLGTARPEMAADQDLELNLDKALTGRTEAPDDELMALDERVRTVVSAMLRSTPEQLQVDSDGDIGIRAGSAMLFVRVRDNPPLVVVFSPVITVVELT